MDLIKKRILLFLLLAFLPVWAACGALMLAPADVFSTTTTAVFASSMLMPALASLLTRLFTKEGFAGMYLRPRLAGNGKRYLAAYFLPSALILVGSGLYFVCFPDSFDTNLTYFRMLAGASQSSVPFLIVMCILIGFLLSPIANALFTLGEELGWRGYLLPHLAERMPARKAALVSGVIWGLWHAPMIVLGHNYGVSYPGYPWAGILLMVLFSVLFGAFLSLLTMKTGSCLPAALAHSALNGMAQLPALFFSGTASPLVGPYSTGILAMVPFLLVGIYCLMRMPTKKAGDATVPGK